MTTQTKQRILVTGASGFIGSHLATKLLGSGIHVRLLVRNRKKLSPALNSSCEIIEGDLLREDALREAVKDTSVIFHCAANVNTWDSWENYYQANVLGVSNLLHAIELEKPELTRFVHISSVDVYGFPVEPCDEKCQLHENTFFYGKSKIRGEAIVRDFTEKLGIPYTILRPANVIGPGSQFISRIGKELQSGLMIEINGGKSNAGILYIDNLIQHIVWAAQTEKTINQVYNVRDSYDVSWAEFIQQFKSGINGKGTIINLPFWLAETTAVILEFFYSIFMPGREPLLHRLLNRFFGKTCGHSANKLHAEHNDFSETGFEKAMETSCEWFLNEQKIPENAD